MLKNQWGESAPIYKLSSYVEHKWYGAWVILVCIRV